MKDASILPPSAFEHDLYGSIALDVLRVRTKKQLNYLINQPVKQLLGYRYSTFFLPNADGTAVNDFFFEPAFRGEHSPFESVVYGNQLTVDDTVFDEPLSAADSTRNQVIGLQQSGFLTPNEQAEWHSLRIPLRDGEQLIGWWLMLYGAQEVLPANRLESMRTVAGLLSASLINILDYAERQKRELDNEIAQSLNDDFAAIRDKKDLLKIIHAKLKTVFDFSDHFVAVINDDESTVSSFLQETHSLVDTHPQYQQSVSARYPLNDGVFNKVFLTKDPMVFELKQQSARGNMPEYFQILYDSGIKKVLLIGLHVREKVLGLWCICLLENKLITFNQLQLVKRLANQLSIVIDNIRTYEAIWAREQEGRLLLKVSEDIAHIRNKNDLFRAINTNLKKLVNFEDIIILIVNEDQSYYAFLFSLHQQSPGYTHYQRSALKKSVSEDCCLTRVMASDRLVVLNMQQLYQHEAAPEYINYEYEKGITEKVAIKLRDGQKDIGVFYVNSANTNAYTDHELALIEGVSYQLSIAVSTILANEEIANREAEKSVLLSLSNEIASLRNRDDLFNVVNTRIKKLFAIEQFGIVKINEDRQTHSAFIMDVYDSVRNRDDYETVIYFKHSVKDAAFVRVMMSEEPVILDVNQLARESTPPTYVAFWLAVGFEELLCLALRVGETPVGAVFFHIPSLNIEALKIDLLKGICAQLAVAVSNILANEAIKKREEEKSMLLSLSNALASVRDRKQLAVIISEELRRFGVIGNYSLRMLTADKKQHQMFLYDKRDHYTQHPEFGEILSRQSDINDGITNVVLASSEPVSFNIEALNQRDLVPPYVRWWKEIGLLELTGTRVRLGDENIGILWLNIPTSYDKEANAPLIKNIGSQIGIALSNILAHEQIITQFNVINRYKEQLEEEKIYLQEEIETNHNYAEIIGNSAEMRKTFRLVSQVASSDSTVLLLGETGTGKELIARAIHNNSPRKSRLLVKINCASLPANLIESELFGHERGSFTGAVEKRIGKFELAHNGTIFLDEIGELPLELQAKLLRVLQEKEIERIGGKNTIQVDVRIIAATNRDLEKEMAEGRFRNDLYYRLNIFPISLPPLRDRPEDIPLLATYFIQRFSKKLGRQISKISTHAVEELVRYSWPGNIRELEHLIERSMLLANGDTIKHIPLPSLKPIKSLNSLPESGFLKTIDENERDHILRVLKYCKGRIAGEGGAAERLGIPKSTLNSKIKRLGIKREHFRE
ncbi:sigma 54-interacting transcriptional regulator [Spirosoma soli]|uniref:Sigma 54-interacting transcriptional regulator n=1 Tax=Spirosoma soli TaxID=1770529 RepID=A0ABW5M6G5_9BACT